MKIRLALSLLIFFIFFSKISLSHEKSIVYIDLNKIMNNSTAGKSITSQLENNHKKNILKFKNIEEELKKEEVNIISQKNDITKEEFEKKINDLNNQRLEATSKMITLVRPILSEFSDENSISLIIDKKNIIIGKTILDITDDILKIVDEKIGKIQLD